MLWLTELLPLIKHSPSSALASPVIIENNVDFPAPFGPSKTTSSFAFSFKEILFKAKKNHNAF